MAKKGWTLETLLYYVERRFKAQDSAVITALAAQEKQTAAALAAAKEATTKAEVTANERFDAGNHIKDAMAEQSALFITRTESSSITDRHAERLNELEGTVKELNGHRLGAAAVMGYVFSAAAVIGWILTLVYR